MQSILGQINFVKGFVPDFSQIVLPLQAMIKKISVLKWGHNQREDFNSIKQSIINSRSLTTPNFSDHFILYTFASETSYVVVLTQLNCCCCCCCWNKLLWGGETRFFCFQIHKALHIFSPKDTYQGNSSISSSETISCPKGTRRKKRKLGHISAGMWYWY